MNTNYTKLKKGDKIRILRKPRMWDSSFCKNSPMRLQFPWEGQIYHMGNIEGWVSAKIGDYGWSISDDDFEFEILNETTYEIY